MKLFKTGIIGCGNIFNMHALPINLCKKAVLVAVCDINEERAKMKAEENNCKYYNNYKEMIEKEKLEVIHICLPHYLHAEVAIYAINKGIHVLTEKPMSIKYDDAKEMVRAAKLNEVTLGVIFQNRYNAGSVLIKDTLKSGKLGNVLSGKLSVTWKRTDEYYTKSDWRGTWEHEGGGVVINQALHTFDLMRWFVGDEIESISASIANRSHDSIEVEDMAEGIIKYKNGVLTSFYTINYYTYDAPIEIELHCDNGIAKLVGDCATVRFNDGNIISGEPAAEDNTNYGVNAKRYWGYNHITQIENFYNGLYNGYQPDVTGEEALKTQQMVCAIYESGKSGKRVKLA